VRAKPKVMARPKAKPKTMAKPKTIDDYLGALDKDKRAALRRLRKIIRDAAPGVEERISYQLPAFRLDGQWLMWLGAAANHCAIYGIVGTLKDELKDYDTSGKGTIRFQADDPLPARLVRKLVRARIAQNAAQRRRPTRGAARRR
jgi:uncharacterized protein YdhG (YjbR/CyaY superfamily)